jgi:hypothetical protein
MNDFGQVPSITFFFPYKEVSGVPVLFRRMAEYLSEKNGVKTFLVDYADGYAAKSLNMKSGVQLITFEDGVPVHIPKDTILVLQSVLPYTMRPELRVAPNTRIIFWTLYPLNLIPTIIPIDWFRHLQTKYTRYNRVLMATIMRPLRNQLQRLITAMAEKNSIFFMDGSNLTSTAERLHLIIHDPIFIPVPSDDAPHNCKLMKTPVEGRPLNFCWLGRLADFKIHILIYTIKALSEYALRNKTPIKMHVIGYGPLAEKLQNLDAENDFFQIIMVGTLTGSALDRYLLEQVDVLAAMGTSALEGAKLGVPTILLDMSYGPVKRDYKFKWIFESKKFSLGEVIDKDSYERHNHSLDRAISKVKEDYRSLSQKTYAYYAAHHSISSVSEKFMAALKKSSFTYGDLRPEILQKSMFRKIYEFVRATHRSWRYAKP